MRWGQLSLDVIKIIGGHETTKMTSTIWAETRGRRAGTNRKGGGGEGKDGERKSTAIMRTNDTHGAGALGHKAG